MQFYRKNYTVVLHSKNAYFQHSVGSNLTQEHFGLKQPNKGQFTTQ